MASSSLKSNPHHHVRSISLPSRLTPQVDENLSRLRTSEATSTAFSSIGNRLSVLENMFDSLDDFLLLSNTQKALLKNEKCCEEILDGYLRLLDLFAMAKEISSKTKHDILGVLSMLRRRDGAELETYLNSRKQTQKAIQKSLKDWKNIKNKLKNNENEATGPLFQEVEEACVNVLESLMLYFASSKPRSKLSAFVNKRILGRILSSKDEVNGFENIDIALDLLLNKKMDRLEDTVQTENVKKQLEEMKSSFEDLEQGLECLFRRFIKTRIAILNILNH